MTKKSLTFRRILSYDSRETPSRKGTVGRGWLKRTRAAVQNPNSGWEQVLGRSVFEVLWSLTGRGPTGPDGWLDEPLPEPTESLRSACAQLGVALPTIRRGRRRHGSDPFSGRR